MKKRRPTSLMTTGLIITTSLFAFLGQVDGHPVLNSTAVNWHFFQEPSEASGGQPAASGTEQENNVHTTDSSGELSALPDEASSYNFKHHGNTDDFVKAARADEDEYGTRFTNPPHNYETVPLTPQMDYGAVAMTDAEKYDKMLNDAKLYRDDQEQPKQEDNQEAAAHQGDADGVTYADTEEQVTTPSDRSEMTDMMYPEIASKEPEKLVGSPREFPTEEFEGDLHSSADGPDEDEYDDYGENDYPEKVAASDDVPAQDYDDGFGDDDDDDDDDDDSLESQTDTHTASPKNSSSVEFTGSDGPQMTEAEADQKELESDMFLNAKESESNGDMASRETNHGGHVQPQEEYQY